MPGAREEPCGRDRRASKSNIKQPELFKVFLSYLILDIFLNNFLPVLILSAYRYFPPIALRTLVPAAETAGCNNYKGIIKDTKMSICPFNPAIL
jgi:hypothetical protein